MNYEELEKRWHTAIEACDKAYAVYQSSLAEYGMDGGKTHSLRADYYEAAGYSNALRHLCEAELGVHRTPDVTVSQAPVGDAGSVTSWREQIVEEAIKEDETPVKRFKTKLEQLQAVFNDTKQHCNHFPQDGCVKFKRGNGYSVWVKNEHGRSVYCWLGTFERAMCFFAFAKERGIPNFSMLRAGVK